MSNNLFNINDNEFVQMTNKLERMSKHDMPVAVRGTINTLAVNVKGARGATTQRATIAKSAKDSFEYSRNKGLFKVMTGFTKATTLEINRMESVAGIVNKSKRGRLAEGLGAQEKGRTIRSKYTPLTRSRRGKAKGSKVARRLYIQNILDDAVDLRGLKGNAYHRAAIGARNHKQHVIWGKKSGDAYIGKINAAYRMKDSIEYDTVVYYRINNSGTVKTRKQNKYVTRAGTIAMKDINEIFAAQAKRRITKSMNK